MMRSHSIFLLAMILGGAPALAAQRPGPPSPDVVLEVTTEPGIAWFGVLADARAEAARTGKPILLHSAAPLCSGVPGMW